MIGAPPGYVGFDQGGLLRMVSTSIRIAAKLLDEIEKPHPDLQANILLQVMDHGRLTDHNGKHVDFRNVILIMTTNAGAADLARAPMGFNRTKREGDDHEAINKLFTPEFRNRLDATISFQQLPMDVVHQVVTKFVMQLEAQLADRGVTFELSEEAIKWLAEKGYDQAMGARPLGRTIQEYIKKPLADEVLFGKLKNGGHVNVVLIKDDNGNSKLGFEFLEGPVTPKAGGDPGAAQVRKPRKPSAKKKPPLSKDDGNGSGDPPRGGTVPNNRFAQISAARLP